MSAINLALADRVKLAQAKHLGEMAALKTKSKKTDLNTLAAQVRILSAHVDFLAATVAQQQSTIERLSIIAANHSNESALPSVEDCLITNLKKEEKS